ncbi:hypothetical protein MSG28_012539 [Choristoneura fumiferana]|uniref:Uncharacterized protein n=1 Tax=Choristoneura fumiferana TaxID=7141 RepID=A0ACC0JH21_CHOFU|nr:hypothetical protein MSG28_012539 [Choristoneura fumiferana]
MFAQAPDYLFIHPGGFYSMTGRSDLFGPHYLLDHDVVLVTINYRLASLGFLSTGDAVAPGNNGFKDQVSALRWLRRNAAAFGGDPQQVTIAGCSAGSISVLLHMVSDMSKGRKMPRKKLSNGVQILGCKAVPKEISKRCPPPAGQGAATKPPAGPGTEAGAYPELPTNSSRAIVDCLKTKTWQEMGNSLLGFWDQFGFDPIGLWTPVLEPDVGQPRFLAVQPAEAIRARRIHSVPLLVSQTEDEFFWKAFSKCDQEQTLRDRMNAEWETIAPISFDLPKTTRQLPAAASKKRIWGEGRHRHARERERPGQAVRMANLMCRYSAHPVWYSEFSYIGNNSFHEDPRTGKPEGAAHHDDLIYLFSMSYFRPPIHAKSPPPPAPQDATIVDRMTAIWYNFATYGDPNPRDGAEPAGLSWPTMTPHDRKYLRVDKQFSVHEKLHEKRLQVWEELYPMQY